MQNEVQDGKNIDYLASQLVSATTYNGGGTAGLPASGDAVVIGDLVGIAATTALATTDLVDVQHRGVFNVNVFGNNGAGSAVVVGDRVYIHATTGVISKTAANVHFGWALAAVASGATTNIPVRLKH